MARLKQLVADGVPAIVPCSSMNKVKEIAKVFEKLYPDSRILAIHGENAKEPEQLRFLLDPNKYAHLYILIIYTPVIEQGLSITVPHFKEVVGFFDC